MYLPILSQNRAYFPTMVQHISINPLHILLAEDSEDDAFFFSRALQISRLNANLSHVIDGEKAISYLSGVPPYSDRAQHPFPDMIVTDLKMPKADGFDLLSWLDSHPACAVIPVIVMSSSYHEPDVAKAYQMGANAFLAKPSDTQALAELLLITYTFWSRCQRPSPPPGLKCS